MQNIICLWSSPRNVSTALMYSFAQRDDTKVFDEVLYAHYLSEANVNHPGREEILQLQDNNGERVINDVILKKRNKISFHKLMTHFLINIDLTFLREVQNIIFIRNPKEIIYSYQKVISNPTINDIGIRKQYKLYHDLTNMGQDPIILDSKYLLKNPEFILRKLCSLLNIDFSISMLKWNQGSIKEDGIWAKYWYKDVHKTEGFLPYYKKKIILDNNNLVLAKECMFYYEFLTSKSIRI